MGTFILMGMLGHAPSLGQGLMDSALLINTGWRTTAYDPLVRR